MNLSNLLTITRIFLTPFLVVILLTKFEEKEIWGLSVFLTASATDWFDGYIARKRKNVTNLGKLLDPLADKLLISSAFISLVELKVVPAWIAVIIIGREIAVTGLRSILALKGTAFPASRLGKTKMFLEVLTISLLILGKNYLGEFFFIGRALLIGTMLIAIYTASEYLIKSWKTITTID
ncbi:MAG: CDP-diacylglycerol--glycerol-3-phosphate 3-phosphatidyltransferase [Candidatus Aminicenantia bacterium]